MSNPNSLFILIGLLMFPLAAASAGSVHKCVIDGQTTYQNTQCAPAEPRKQPTVEQLNAERQKRLRELSASDAGPAKPQDINRSAPAARAAAGAHTPDDASRPQERPPQAAPAASPTRCDGRTHCSQMTSCAEAKYFLARCPNVQMDGDRDGIPCEDQWCRP